MPDRDVSLLFGLTPQIPLVGGSEPIRLLRAEWPWADPLAAILRFAGWTIHDVVSDPRVAAGVRILWKTLQAGRRQTREREEWNRALEQLRWRREGLPVSCPLCGASRTCGCRAPASPRGLSRLRAGPTVQRGSGPTAMTSTASRPASSNAAV